MPSSSREHLPSVRNESARTERMLPVTDVVIRVQVPGLPKLFHGLVPGFGVLSPFQYDGPQSGDRQGQSREHTGGAESHHNRAKLGNFFRLQRFVPDLGGAADLRVPAASQDLVFAFAGIGSERKNRN